MIKGLNYVNCEQQNENEAPGRDWEEEKERD